MCRIGVVASIALDLRRNKSWPGSVLGHRKHKIGIGPPAAGRASIVAEQYRFGYKRTRMMPSTSSSRQYAVPRFSRPSIRYLSRHSLPPAGVISKNIPPPSAILIGFGPGFAARMLMSVSAMIRQPFRGYPFSEPRLEYPQWRGYRIDHWRPTPQTYPHQKVIEREQ